MKAVICKVWKAPAVVEVDNELHALQRLVGGHIEVVPYSQDGKILLVCNEEGRLLELEPNRNVLLGEKYEQAIFGDFLLVGARGEEFTDLTPEQADYVLNTIDEGGWLAYVL